MNKQIYLLLALVPLVLFSCKKPDDGSGEENEEELITTVELTFTKADSTAAQTVFVARDIDGDGGNPIEIDPISLDSASNYTLSLRFLDESGMEVEDITEEVREEDDEHLVCFNTDTDITVTPTDSDGTYAVGLTNSVSTVSAISGEIIITLKHQPGVKNGDCALGETDIEVSFPVTVQ